MRLEGVEVRHGWVGENGDGAITACEEEVGWWACVIKRHLIGLHALVVGCAGCWCGRCRDGNEVVILSPVSSRRSRELQQNAGVRTFLPTRTTLPSAAHAIVKPSPPRATVAVHVFVFTSQNLQVPSLETEASSASFAGFHATLSMGPVCPLSSVLLFTWGFSGFHIRSVRSAEPVAMRFPNGLHAIVRMLSKRSMRRWLGL